MSISWQVITQNIHVSEKQLTANVDLQLTEVCQISHWKLHDEVSVGLQAAGTLQGDCSRESNGSRVLTADSVVPQRRFRDGV